MVPRKNNGNREIGSSLPKGCNRLEEAGPVALTIDCDILNADGVLDAPQYEPLV